MKVSRILVHVRMSIIVFVGALFFGGNILSVQAALYAPGATLDPACLPTDVDCGVQNDVATGTAGQIAYYATTGGLLSGTSSLVTTATSTFAGLNITSLGLRVATLNASGCDLKATTDGTFYCGNDAVGGSPTWGSITGTLSAQTDLWNILDPKLSTTTLALFDKGFFFSTTSATYWEGTQTRWATSSADYFINTKGTLPNLSTLAGLVSFGSSSATTTDLGSLIVNGKVGIGTTNPLVATHIVGPGGGASVTATPNGALLLGANASAQVLSFGVIGGSGAHSWIQSRANNAATFSPLALNPNGGNVGIGTTSPQRKLHITNDGSLSQLLLEATSSGADQHYWGFQASSTGAFVLNSLTDGLVSTNRLMVDVNGKVGIGTASPGKVLDVNGDVRIRGDNATLNFYRLTSPTDIVSMAYDQTAGSFSINAKQKQFNINSGSVSANTFSINQTGTTVNIPLGRITQGGAASPNTFAAALQVTSATSSYFVGGGSVGIGTTTPGAFLNVLGTTEQLRLSYDAANYASFTTASNGALTIATTPGASGITTGSLLTAAGGLRTMSTANQSNLAAFSASSVSNFNIAALNLAGATSTDVRILMRGSTNGGLVSNASYASLNIGQQAVTENTSGNHPLLSQLAIRPLAVTAGAATVDNTATLYIEDSASTTVVGTGNYALWIDNGISRFDGNVGVGTSSPATALDVNGTITQLAQKGCSTGLTTDALGSINGCVASDERLKKNVESLTLSLDALNKLSPVTYEWKDENRDTQIHAGFIAQEVEKVLPQAVVSAGNGFKGVDPNAVLALVVRAIQGFAQSITTLVLNATTVNTKELCVDGTCITGDQLRHMLQQSDQQSAPATVSMTPSIVQPITVPSDTSSSTTGETTEATSTETASTTETTDPTPVPDNHETADASTASSTSTSTSQ